MQPGQILSAVSRRADS